jgi:diguanylate cyclase (GGDEF)-like protein
MDALLTASTRVRALIETVDLDVAFQPIVRLADFAVVAYEALARPRVREWAQPARFLAAADGASLRVEAELACWLAVARAGTPPRGRLLFVNVSPGSLAHPGFLARADDLPADLVIELVERDADGSARELRQTLAPWTERGVRFAVDDLGVGSASLRAVLELEPSFVKLDRELVRDVHRDARRRSLLTMLVGFARETGITLVAEGVERREELAVLRGLGVDWAQGFLLGRPALAWSELAPSARPLRLVSARAALPDLGEAPSVREACRVVVDHFWRGGELLPSLYLERGGVLRCQALRGYRQLLDGVSPGSGVIGTVFETGEPIVLDDVEHSDDHVVSAPGVVADVAVPIRTDGRMAGVLNVESRSALPPGLVDDMRAAARELGGRIAHPEISPTTTPADRLARHAASLAGLADVDEIARRVVDAGRDVSGLGSAMLATEEPSGTFEVRAASGPLAGAFVSLDAGALALVSGWVREVRSCYTCGDGDGHRDGLTAHDALRAAGVESMAVLPLEGPAGRAGMLVLADGTPVRLVGEEMELLELLAAQGSACLRMAGAVEALTERAARDPLTGLGHLATFQVALRNARGEAPATRRIAVLLADVDEFKSINDTRGHLAGDQALRAIAAALSAGLRASDRLFRIGGDEFAALVEVGSADEALRVARRLVEAVRGLGRLSISVGVAVAGSFEPADALFARADTALYSVKRHGRDGAELAEPAAPAAPVPEQRALWSEDHSGALPSEAQR